MSKQKYVIDLIDTADPEQGVSKSLLIEVGENEQAEDVALDTALSEGQYDEAHYLVVGIHRGDGL